MERFYVGPRIPYDELNRSWYDTKQGIMESLDSLESFCQLLEARHTASYDRGERLNEFYVFGRYYLDTCGNYFQATQVTPKILLPEIPNVLTREEFWQYLEKNDSTKSLSHLGFGGSYIPFPGLKCSHCGKTWDIHDCHDTVTRQSTEVYSLADFVGQSLFAVKYAYGIRDDAVYRMPSAGTIIRNDKFIDLSPEYPDPKNDWEKKAVKNEHGWIGEKDGITDTYVIQPGDEGYFSVWKYFHTDCMRQDLSNSSTTKFQDLFQKAGFTEFTLTIIPNEYWPSGEICAPWYNVVTRYGTIKIGWRKRVINIDWSGLRRTKNKSKKNLFKAILSLFDNEDVTKETTYIHAWGWDKAQDYLTQIYQLLSQQ